MARIGFSCTKLFFSKNEPIEAYDLKGLKKYINYMWFSFYNIMQYANCKINNSGYIEPPLEIFDVSLETVDCLNVPNNNNKEDIYVALFKTDEDLKVLLI